MRQNINAKKQIYINLRGITLMKKFENILVAFDLNKTLFFKSQSPLPRRHDKKIKKLFFYYRPHLNQLIEYLHSNQINYCFWSNMLGRNCIKYIKQLQLLGMSKYCGIFDQSFCDKAQNISQSQQKVKSIKDLNKLAKLFEIDVDSCVLVDDSKSKNVQGCNLIQVRPFQGEEKDNQILNVIQQLKIFRNQRIDINSHKLPMLKFKEFNFEQQVLLEAKKIQKIEEKCHQPSQLDKLMDNYAPLQKLKKDLALQKQLKKNLISQIQLIQKNMVQMAQQVKKKSQGKVVRKGDQLLVEVLMFAKNKKVSQKKLEQLKLKKKTSDQKIQIIKKLMRGIVQKLSLQLDQKKLYETDVETPHEKQKEHPNFLKQQQKKSNLQNKQQNSLDKPQVNQKVKQ